MRELLTLLGNACDPQRPASPVHFVDCSQVRGGGVFARKLQKELPREGGFVRFLFSGHMGSGKSSELLHLKTILEHPHPTEEQKRFFVIVLDSEEYLEPYDVSAADILLSIVSEVAEQFRTRLKIELKDSYLSKRIGEAWDTLKQDVETPEADVTLLPALKVKVKTLKADPTARKKVRESLMPQTAALIAEINQVFSKARLELKKHQVAADEAPYFDFVLVVDNLEKIERYLSFEQGEASHRALFLESASQLTSFNAHVIYTVPLGLVRAAGTQLGNRYGRQPFVLPMIKTEHRKTHAPYEAGIKKMLEILARRSPKPLVEMFTDDALDFLVKYSGGHVRQFMASAREATLYADTLPIALRDVQKAVTQPVPLFSTGIGPTQWEKLATLEVSEDQQWDPFDPDTNRFLEGSYLLEYINGEAEEDPFSPLTPWYAVHPIVRELAPFKSAVARQKLAAPSG